MKIISTNLGKPTTILWKGETEKTGIFKYPSDEPLFLGKTDVKGDSVIDRVHHAGVNKACYLFASYHYPYWKEKYPDLDWDWGMFGENLTVEGLDESVIRIGNVYKIGTALVQVSQPREPCYKLGIRFKNQDIVKQFVDHSHPGTYVRILEEGAVKQGDEMKLMERSDNPLTVQDFYRLIYARPKPQATLKLFMENLAVPQYKKDRFRKYLV
ncbi:MOSC domain-containing protein [Maribacter sp. 2210JD10-5]|uniref:MOSC domain-containing protein n=1 Tax=Maribacter sp. 2210JD10-5 TaxID=3386272 RepID=UPI0039BCB6DE